MHTQLAHMPYYNVPEDIQCSLNASSVADKKGLCEIAYLELQDILEGSLTQQPSMMETASWPLLWPERFVIALGVSSSRMAPRNIAQSMQCFVSDSGPRICC